MYVSVHVGGVLTLFGAHSRSTMDQEVIRRRNTVFNIIYRRVTLHYTQFVPKAARWTLEITCLLLVGLRSATIYNKAVLLHVTIS